MPQDLLQFLPLLIPIIIAITLHEAAHGYVAWMLGDPTAKSQGRVSFNPLKHVDPVGTVLIPVMLHLSGAKFFFGYAKPVPVDFSRLSKGRCGIIWVALAGPGMNLILAMIFALMLRTDVFFTQPARYLWLFETFQVAVITNLALAIFNMMPILPLDGGRILNALLPAKIARLHGYTERYGLAIVLLLVAMPSMTGIPVTYYLIQLPVMVLYKGVLQAVGIQAGCLTPALCYGEA